MSKFYNRHSQSFLVANAGEDTATTPAPTDVISTAVPCPGATDVSPVPPTGDAQTQLAKVQAEVAEAEQHGHIKLIAGFIGGIIAAVIVMFLLKKFGDSDIIEEIEDEIPEW